MQPLILTLKMDAIAFEILNHLRQQHFPTERNFLPAHITLFHALPGEQEDEIRETLRSLNTPKIRLSFPRPRFLGRGVAIDLKSSELLALRQNLAQAWSEYLTPQDRQGYRPHVTIQNKVTPQAARQLYAQLSGTWEPLSGAGEALLLWFYRGGPWELVEEFLLAGTSS